jgi:CRISPR-associated protein Cas2
MRALTVYIVAYDIRNPTRLRKVHKTMRGFGDAVQLSVFRCVLTDANKVRMITRLEATIHQGEDQVLIVPLGPEGGRHDSAIETIGVPLQSIDRHAIVI